MPIFAQPFRPSMRNYFSHFVSTEHNMYRFISEDTSYIPPFACAFANTSKHGHKLAVADEEGIIGIIDTNKDNRWEAEHARPQWLAHVNAIFDICWTSDDRQIASAAGDQTVRIWDVETARCTAIFQGHNCSIKSVANHPSNPHIFATAARDGRIMTWDTRSASIAPDAPESRYRPTNTINNAHALQKGPVKKTRGQSNPSQSVTSVRFMPHSEDTLASSGAADGLIKLWDLRSPAAFSRKDNPSPLSTSHVLDGNRRAHGFSSLCMDSIGSRIYAACTDNRIYEFDSSTLGKPIQKFSAAEYRCDTFYIKTTVSPDDRFLASGSSDHGLYIWEIDHPEKPPLVLRAHRGEVTGLSWSKQELSRIAACSDDATVRIWNVDLDYDEAEQDFAYRDYRGKAEEGKLRIEEEEASPAPKLITSQAVPSPVDQNNENEAPTSSNANLTSTPRAHVAGTPRSGLAARRTNSGPVNSLNRPNARNTPVRTIADYFASPTTTPST
ncbi:hypothetical protein HKX48_007245 [Thoreauomyces humboldtii]|nr:hypothetical protein HKX48_007245 [Thoreauomyces humboldtii]